VSAKPIYTKALDEEIHGREQQKNNPSRLFKGHSSLYINQRMNNLPREERDSHADSLLLERAGRNIFLNKRVSLFFGMYVTK
jgi:hypothetical protein